MRALLLRAFFGLLYEFVDEFEVVDLHAVVRHELGDFFSELADFVFHLNIPFQFRGQVFSLVRISRALWYPSAYGESSGSPDVYASFLPVFFTYLEARTPLLS